VINTALGMGHVLKSGFSMIRRWRNDPNLNVEHECERNENYIAEKHAWFVAARPDRALSSSPAPGAALEVAKCQSCHHRAHLGLCTARSGGTAYACACSRQAELLPAAGAAPLVGIVKDKSTGRILPAAVVDHRAEPASPAPRVGAESEEAKR
jgi:hypothetical protein